MPFDDYYGFRDRLVDSLIKDLIGPSEELELIADPPLTRYIAGILFPRSDSSIDLSEDIDLADDDDESGPPDPPIAMANVRYPSSMGLTLAVDITATSWIEIQVESARYEQKEIEPDAKPKKRGPRRRADSSAIPPWQRIPVRPNAVRLNVTEPHPGQRFEITDGLQVFCRIRPAQKDGIAPVTVVLLNTKTSQPGQLKDGEAFFQSRIRILCADCTEAPFRERPKSNIATNDEDLQSYALLYRHVASIAVGHGCSVEWQADSKSPDRATEVSTSYAPRFALLLSDSNPDIEIGLLTMKRLAEGRKEDLLIALRAFCDDYRSWITEQAGKVMTLVPALQEVASSNISTCRETLQRMEKGVQLLQTDELAWKAFQFANAAMFQQRARTVWLHAGKPNSGPSNSDEHRWRPFQLAFMLICLQGIADEHSTDRGITDLLWFPTGGGKTEAYLGLIAFTIFLRRLRNPRDAGGTSVLMRYTLRLLTIQQFERASLLICCCEDLRLKYPELGQQAIWIGLWVGQGATPNSLSDTRTSLDKLRQGVDLIEQNPVQLHSCPWCGEPLDHKNYYIASINPRLVITCKNDSCRFAKELPVSVIDDDIYNRRPSLVISTVDKFASLPWKEQTSNLFNLNRPSDPPPDLIVQDELHLISGPLGTLTGLYETALDVLCASRGVKPKIVASTATIRRARQQTLGLFDRPVRQFPPSSLDARNSYFALEADADRRGTRLYVGLMAPGTSQTTLLVRCYAALLQLVQDLPALDKTKDPYWTLVGYFNSLRVLGGARMQVQDDVGDRMALLAAEAKTVARPIEQRIELTSRESSAQIPRHLKQMACECPSDQALDVILATNMISVGVDIDRLGLMAVMGQPQSTSEYIQATSRVGRRFPGLVLTLYNAARSRDRSHYESFISYHGALYRQVESTSVTPFSPRARDRGLHAVLVILARMLVPCFRPNSGAAAVQDIEHKLEPAKQAILERVRSVAPQELNATEMQLDQLISDWKKRGEENPNLVFSNPAHPDRALLVDAAADDSGEGVFRTLWSLRDVDKSSNLYLVR